MISFIIFYITIFPFLYPNTSFKPYQIHIAENKSDAFQRWPFNISVDAMSGEGKLY